MAPLVPTPSACPFDGLCHIISYAGGPMDGVTGARPLCVSIQQGHLMGGPTDGAAGARPPRAIYAHDHFCH